MKWIEVNDNQGNKILISTDRIIDVCSNNKYTYITVLEDGRFIVKDSYEDIKQMILDTPTNNKEHYTHWVWDENSLVYRCSACGACVRTNSDYCPSCGLKAKRENNLIEF